MVGKLPIRNPYAELSQTSIDATILAAPVPKTAVTMVRSFLPQSGCTKAMIGCLFEQLCLDIQKFKLNPLDPEDHARFIQLFNFRLGPDAAVAFFAARAKVDQGDDAGGAPRVHKRATKSSSTAKPRSGNASRKGKESDQA